MSLPTTFDPAAVDERVLAAIHDHVDGELEREVGGILAGRLVDGCAEVEVAIPALRAEGHRTNVTFTHDVWEDVLALLDRDHPELRIVGWYHSHPGFGIFLSAHDRFIQENFFPAEGMVALVVDPHTGASGWFASREGDVVRLDGDQPVGAPRDRAPGLPSVAAVTPAAGQTRGARSLLAVGAVLVGFTAGWVIGQSSEPTVATPETAATDDVDARGGGPDPVEQLTADLEAAGTREADLERRLSDTEQTVTDLESELAQAPRERPVATMDYRVRRGDTLGALARAFSDEADYLGRLTAANPQLDDPDLLTVGQPITLPPMTDTE